jgi:hypothetical protein
MKKKDSFPLVTKIVGIIITAWILFLVTIELIRAFKVGIESFFYDPTNILSLSHPYIDANVLILVYLVGYAIVWWKKLWGTVIILIVSILGIILSQAGDIRFHFVLTFLVGFLYFMNWKEERKINK